MLSEFFQESIEVEYLGLNVHIIYNDVLCAATLTSKSTINKTAQHLSTRYFFSQFWSEFTS
jgi:hypothetical protein